MKGRPRMFFEDGRAYVGAMVAKSFARQWRKAAAREGLTTSQAIRAALELWVAAADLRAHSDQFAGGDRP